MDDDLRRFEAAVDRFAEALNKPGNTGNQSTVTINAGGAAVWIAASAVAVMLALNLALMVMLVNHDRKIDDLEHYINAIYMLAPSLKPQEK